MTTKPLNTPETAVARLSGTPSARGPRKILPSFAQTLSSDSHVTWSTCATG